MEKVWRKPETQVQWFVPNEYVAACVTGQIVCAIPGHSPYECNDGTRHVILIFIPRGGMV